MLMKRQFFTEFYEILFLYLLQNIKKWLTKSITGYKTFI